MEYEALKASIWQNFKQYFPQRIQDDMKVETQ